MKTGLAVVMDVKFYDFVVAKSSTPKHDDSTEAG
jgi:hypothetical protein